MINKLRQQIDNIQHALDWIKANEPQDYERQFLNFVEERRKLRKIAEAEEMNPAVAAYGESQKGKSYLMSNLLQKDGKPFLIHCDGKDYSFIDEMNPITKDTEATGVITRFSSFQCGSELYSEQHPIAMRTLTVCDIILILTDSYYQDIRDYHVADNIKERVDAFYDQYSVRASQGGFIPVVADDVLEMQAYIKKYVNAAQHYVGAGYFKRLALIADRIPVSDYEKVYGLLWDNNEYYSSLFTRMMALLQRINYSSYIYLPVEALLHHGTNENTIMSVQCLHGLTGTTTETEVYLRRGDEYTTVRNVQKCELSAICAEVVIKIPQDFVDSSASYSTESITDGSVLAKITKTPIKKDILKNVDLLDFPGARSREKQAASTLGGGNILSMVFLRGKVAYIFNKYNENRTINILLFCHDYIQKAVSEIPLLLETWINNYVGASPAARTKTIEQCGGIAPLFFIATKFNVDMAESQNMVANEESAINERWVSRFKKVLYNEVFNGGAVEWVNNWTGYNEKFYNSYLLRDFKYSGEKGSKLYSDFSTKGVEVDMTIPQDYYNLMRSTFCTNDSVKQFFDNPALAWDLAASKNNDGALYVIERLGIVAARMLGTRTMQFEEIMHKAQKVVLDAMSYYRPANGAEEQMAKNINNAYGVLRELDFACNNDNYFYGHLMEGLQMTERDIYDQLHRLVMGGSLNEPINDFEQYQIIRERCRNFEGCNSLEEKWQMLIKFYHYPSKEYGQNDLKRRNVDTDILFADKLMPQLPSYIIADKMLETWKNKITSVDFLNTYSSDEGFAPMVLTELVNNIVDAVHRFNMLEILHNDIKAYTDIAAVQNIPVSLVADIIASSISNFVMDMGYSMMDEAKIAELRELARSEGWPVFNYISKKRQELFVEEEIAAIFNQVLSSGSALTPAFKYNFFSWEEFVFLSFASRVERPKYSLEVSQRLSEIIDNIQLKTA